MSDIGAIKKIYKVSEGDGLAIPLAKKLWTPVARFELSEVGTDNDLGWALIDGELYGDLPVLFPKGIESRWARRADGNPNDPDLSKRPDYTKRTNLAVGGRVDWAGVVPTTIEFLTKSDFPLELHVWHNATTVWSLHTVIAAIYAPATYIASRLTLGDD